MRSQLSYLFSNTDEKYFKMKTINLDVILVAHNIGPELTCRKLNGSENMLFFF